MKKNISIDGFKEMLETEESKKEFIKGMESYGFFLDDTSLFNEIISLQSVDNNNNNNFDSDYLYDVNRYYQNIHENTFNREIKGVA